MRDDVVFKSLKSNLIFAALAVVLALWAVPQARATVIVSASDVSADLGFEGGFAALITIDPMAVVLEASPGGMTGLPTLPTDGEREREARRDWELKILHGSLMDVPADMSPSSNSLVQLTGSAAGGFAAPSDVVTPPPAEHQASLPREARTTLPTGPPYRWFRPPRA